MLGKFVTVGRPGPNHSFAALRTETDSHLQSDTGDSRQPPGQTAAFPSSFDRRLQTDAPPARLDTEAPALPLHNPAGICWCPDSEAPARSSDSGHRGLEPRRRSPGLSSGSAPLQLPPGRLQGGRWAGEQPCHHPPFSALPISAQTPPRDWPPRTWAQHLLCSTRGVCGEDQIQQTHSEREIQVCFNFKHECLSQQSSRHKSL